MSLSLNEKETEDEKSYRLGIQGYHFQNLLFNLDISQDELQQISGKKKTATSSRNVIEEYFRSHQNLDAKVEGRLIFTN